MNKNLGDDSYYGIKKTYGLKSLVDSNVIIETKLVSMETRLDAIKGNNEYEINQIKGEITLLKQMFTAIEHTLSEKIISLQNSLDNIVNN